jgi:four helix bundle protein
VRGYRDLIAWQKAMSLVTEIYRVTQSFPREELYGLTSQLRRAAVSVPSNLAEGYARNSRNEFRHFIGQARGSLAEIETQVEIAKALGFLTPLVATGLLKKTEELSRILAGLREWSRNSG